jgi:hypothetical protein
MPANRTVDVLRMPEDVCKACLGRILAQLPDEGLRLRPCMHQRGRGDAETSRFLRETVLGQCKCSLKNAWRQYKDVSEIGEIV